MWYLCIGKFRMHFENYSMDLLCEIELPRKYTIFTEQNLGQQREAEGVQRFQAKQIGCLSFNNLDKL